MLSICNRDGARIHKLITLIIIATSLLSIGCGDGATTWSARVPSPDGSWVAIGRTEQLGGPGNAGDITTVCLQRRFKSPESFWAVVSRAEVPMQILVFSHQYARMRLKMRWLSPAHLEVMYGPSEKPGDHVEVDFQVVKIAGIGVSLQKFNSSSAEPQQ
jgi:hypothetical protein